MSSQIAERVIIVPTSLDYDRVGQIFDEISPDKVYILYNKDPIESHKEVNQKTLQGVQSIVDSETGCSGDDVRKEGVNFYRFDETLTEVFRIIYREDQMDNEVLVNLSGGTKPVAIALAFTCAITGAGRPIYYVAENYETTDQGKVRSSGVADISFDVPAIHFFDLSDIMPEAGEKEEIILKLLSEERAIGVTEMLVQTGLIEDSDNIQTEEQRSSRNNTVTKYHGHARSLVNDGILEKNGSAYQLTETGHLIAKLINVKREVDGQTSLSDF